MYQGIDKVVREEGIELDIKGHVMDSCPGPRPEITLGRCDMYYSRVHWISNSMMMMKV